MGSHGWRIASVRGARVRWTLAPGKDRPRCPADIIVLPSDVPAGMSLAACRRMVALAIHLRNQRG